MLICQMSYQIVPHEIPFQFYFEVIVWFQAVAHPGGRLLKVVYLLVGI